MGREESRKRPTPNAAAPGQAGLKGDRGRGRARGRGPVEAPPAGTPVKRGPPESKPGTQRAQPAPSLKPKQVPATGPPRRSKATQPAPKANKGQAR